MKFIRVIPRDLFNEAKIYKCMGQLILMIEDRMGVFAELTYNQYKDCFTVHLDEDGALWLSGVHIFCAKTNLVFRTTYNSKAPYPLHCFYENQEIPVFTDDGKEHEDFVNFISTIK